MHDQPIEGKTTAQRLFLLCVSLCVGAVGWFLMGEAESLDAAESARRSASVDQETSGPVAGDRSGGKILAQVGGVALTEVEVLDSIADELALIDEQRQALVAAAVEQKVREVLIEQESQRRGLDRSTLVASEVARRLDRISDAAVETFYRQQRIAEPLANAAPKIRRHLALESFIADLEAARGVERMIELSPRQTTASH